MRKWYSNLSIVVTLVFICLAVWRDCSLLFQSHVAVGIDGYYYVLQINTLRNEGHLYFQTSTPFVIYLLTLLCYLTQDAILAAKFGAVVLHISLSLGVLAFILIITRSFWLGFFGFLITAFSSLHLYFISEFLSNLGGLTFMVWAVCGAVKFAHTKKYIWGIISGLLLLVTMFSHRSMIGFILFGVFIYLLAYIFISPKFELRSKFSVFIITGILFVLPLVIAWQPFFDLPQQLKVEFLKFPTLPFRQINLAECSMLSITLLITIYLFIYRSQIIQNNIASLTTISIILWSFLLTLNPFFNHHTGFQGFAGRIGSLSYIQAAMSVPILLHILFSVSIRLLIGVTITFTFLLLFSYFTTFPPALRKENLQIRERLVNELPAMRSQLCNDPFIVAQHGDQFIVTALLNVPSQQKPPIHHKQQCIYWLIRQSQTDESLSFVEGTIRIQKEFIFIEDKDIRQKIPFLSREQQRSLFAMNPHLRQIFAK